MEPDLHFCSRCGTRVPDYPPSITKTFHDGWSPTFDYDVETTYDCPHCGATLIAMNIHDARSFCSSCARRVCTGDAFCAHCAVERLQSTWPRLNWPTR